MITVVILIYTAWAIYSGWKITTRRIPALNKRTPNKDWKKDLPRIIGKVIVSVLIGYVFGAFYFIGLVLKWLGLMNRWL